MAHVICKYTVECGDPDDFGFEELFLEGTYKRCEWDGLSLHVAGKIIHSHEYFLDAIKNDPMHCGYYGGANDIQYLKIDDTVYIGDS